jgi:hypothetical protein
MHEPVLPLSAPYSDMQGGVQIELPLSRSTDYLYRCMANQSERIYMPKEVNIKIEVIVDDELLFSSEYPDTIELEAELHRVDSLIETKMKEED